MIRLLIGFGFLFLIAAFAAVLADHPGRVVFSGDGYEVETSVAVMVGFFAATMILSATTMWLVGWIKRDAPFIGEKASIRRQGRGLVKLNKALVAMAAGDHRTAKALVGEAEVLLPAQPMVHLLAAEAALRSGDTDGARSRYKALEAMEDGRFLGLRGLLLSARRSGREAEALRLARAAFEHSPKSPWVLSTLFSLEVAAGHWAEAEIALDKVQKSGLVDKAQAAQHRGALAFARAAEAVARGDSDAARSFYKSSLKHRPGFAPAIAALARIEHAAGKTRAGLKLIETAWRSDPHRALARAFKALDVTESREDYLKRARKLAALNPDHPRSLMLIGEAALQASVLDSASEAANALAEHADTRERVALRLDIARALGGDVVGLERALATAPDEGHWACSECGHRPDIWSALCSDCGAFDSYMWAGGVDQGVRAQQTSNDAILLLAQDDSGTLR